MKKALKRILTFALVLCLTVIGVVTVPMVSANAADGTWTLVTDASTLAVDDQIIIAAKASNVALSTTQNGNNRGQTAITKNTADNTLNSPSSDVQILTLKAGKTSGTWAFYTGSGYLFAASSSKNYLRTETSLSDNSSWNISITSAGVATVKATGTNTKNLLKHNSQSKLFSCYGSGQNDICLYKLVEAATDPDTPVEPDFTLSGETVTMVGNALTLTATPNEGFTETPVIEWSSNAEEIATVANGVVTPVSMGKATITASAGEVSKSVEITVYPSNTDEITIAQALAICAFTGSITTPYTYTTTGDIESIDAEYSEQYNNIEVTITDGTDSIKVYRMKGGADLSVGMNITVTGNLKKYGETLEFDTGASYVVNKTDAQEAMQEALNEVNAYMSLSYKYTQTTETQEVAAEVTDTLNNALTGATGNGYISWSGKKVTSDAVYAGNSAGSNSSIQLRSDNSKASAGVITTVSGGKAKKVILSWHSATTEGRTVDIYGKNTAYTSTTELYNTSTQGTKLGSLKKGETELEITGDYEYIAFRSNSGALYLISVQITWATGAGEGMEEVTVMKDSDFRIRCGVDASLLEIAGEYNFGIQVSANGKTVEYTTTATSWTEENGMVYVVISLGDIINDLTKLDTKFTVTAFVEVDGVILTSTVSKNMSVVDMVAYYLDNEDIKEVTHLYDYLANAGLI